jgi:hypothetical protein
VALAPMHRFTTLPVSKDIRMSGAKVPGEKRQIHRSYLTMTTYQMHDGVLVALAPMHRFILLPVSKDIHMSGAALTSLVPKYLVKSVKLIDRILR